jgi:hypothetical protein
MDLNDLIALMAASLLSGRIFEFDHSATEQAVRNAKKIWAEVLKQERE